MFFGQLTNMDGILICPKFWQWLFLFLALACHTGWSWSKDENFKMVTDVMVTSKSMLSPESDSDFETGVPNFVRVAAGATAYLGCRPRSLRNKTVSWVRHRDVHILTVGRYTYTTDGRFLAFHQRHSGEWTLQLRSAQPRDSGLYECQIGTQPTRSFFVNLQVVEPKSSIPGGPDMHVHEGSVVNISCIVHNSVEQPDFFFWYHNGKVVVFDRDRVEKRENFPEIGISVSSMIINQVQVSDSGNYSCQPAHCAASSIRLHVLKGEQPAAMQRSSTPNWHPVTLRWSIFLMVFISCFSWLNVLFRV